MVHLIGMLPIRKIAPDKVALTSYYGKTFVSKDLKKVNDYSSWLNARIMVKGLDPFDPDINNLLPANVFDNTYPCTKIYSSIAMSFKGFTSQGFDFNFDHTTRTSLTDEKTLKSLEINGRILVATNALDHYLVLDKDGIVYEIEDDKETLRGTLENFLNIQTSNAPMDFVNIKIFGKEIPVGLVLGYLLGFDTLIKLLKVKYRKVPTGTRVNLDDSEYAVIFKDETICFDKDNRLAALILAGFSSLDKVTKNYTQNTFNSKGVYLNLLDFIGLGSRYIREIELIDSMFIDPITLELLKEMKEPTTFRGLLVRSTEMLMNDQHPDMMDMRYMRIKGYERLSGAVYAELVQALREHKSKGGRATQPVALHPYAVWKRITQDPSITISIDINPIQNLKETEAVTFSGVGGRMSRAMVKRTRGYHPTDMGVISESTVDSSDVAINTFLSADPKFNSLRGTSDRYEIGKSGITSLLSTAALLSVGSDRDD